MLMTMKDIIAALTEENALLIFDERFSVQSYFILRANGQRIRCAKIADRLTWGANPRVRFSHRDALTRYYTLSVR